MVKKKNIIKRLFDLFLVIVFVVAGLPNFMEANANSSYYYDEATVYDMSELSEGKVEAIISDDYENSLGTLSSTENVAIQFKFTKPTGLNWGLKQRFLNPEPNNYFNNQGYYIFYHCQGRGEICILEGDVEIDQPGAKYSSTPFEFTGEQIVEIGAVNVYADATKTTKIGREIYVKVDGEKIVTYLDTTISDGDVGSYVTVPVVDGNFDANSGKLKIANVESRIDEATVYDMSELSEGKEEAFISGDYENSLGTLPTTENVAVKFKFTKPTGLNWGLKQRFLNPEPNNYFSNQGYYIFYHCQGHSEICILEGAAEIDQSGAKFSSAPFEFTGEHVVEVGSVNLYEDATKTTKIGREIYVKVDGEKIASYLDTTISDGDVGSYVTVPVVDGNFDSGSGKLEVAYTLTKIYTPEEYAAYRANNNVAPTIEGYVFAGWFSDKECKTVLQAATTTNVAYAKFVDFKVLTVQAQITENTNADSTSTDIRFVATVDSLYYSEVGFDITIEGYSKKTIHLQTVYNKLYAVGCDVETSKLSASQTHCRVSKYFFAYSFWEVPNEHFNTEFEVTPYWITLDGTIVYGETTIKKVSHGYKNAKYVDSAQKVLQKTKYTGPEKSTLSIKMARGETEGVQIILTPKTDVSSVEVVTYDLYDGNVKLAKENIQVYWEKYLEITDKYNENPSYPQGSFVPDALLPMETAREYEENKVFANENQGIWIDVTTTSDTPSGNYCGKVDVIIDGLRYSHELDVDVVDIDLSSVEGEVNFWSVHMRDSFSTNEMDSSDEMAAAYFEKMLEYNIQTDLPFSGEGGAEAFAQMVKKYYDYQGFSSYRFYYERSNHWEAGVHAWYVNPDVLEEYVRALAVLSVEDHKDYFDKAFFILSNIVDEPYSEEAYKKVEIAYGRLHTALIDISIKLSTDFAGHENYAFYEKTVKRSIANIPLTLAESMSDVARTLEKEYELQYISHNCSLEFYNSVINRYIYNSYVDSIDDGDTYDTQQWWYTCVNPTYPYPSNHLDDDVLGLKTMFWMQNYYDIDGHFNWSLSCYQDADKDETGRDPYTNGLYMTGLPMGDGYITYPGYPYSIYGPVMSIRAASIRDGVDDAKYMQIVRLLYEKDGTDVTRYLSSLCRSIFTGTKTTADVEAYNSVREDIIETILTLQDEYGALEPSAKISSHNKNGKQAIVTKEKATGNAKVLRDDDALETFMIADFESYEEIIQMKTKNSLGTLSEITDKNFVKNGFQSLKLKVHGRENLNYNTDQDPMLEIYTARESIGKIDYSNYNEFRICMYNAMDHDVMMQFMVNDNYSNRRAIWLEPGWNDVVIDIDSVLYKELLGIGEIQKFQFIFDRGELHGEKEVVYLDAFRAVRTKDISSKLTYKIEEGVINNFDEQHDLNYVLNGCFAYTSEFFIGNGLTQSVFKESGNALRIHARVADTVRTDVIDEWRVALMQPELLKAMDLTQYKDQNVCFDVYNNGTAPVKLYVYYYQEAVQAYGTREEFIVAPGQTLNFKQLFSKVLDADDGMGGKWKDSTAWTGLMIGFDIPHPTNGNTPVDLIVDNYRFE